MPSSLHEALVEIFRNRPGLSAELLGQTLAVDLPTYDAVRIESGDLTVLVPTEYRADVVTVLTDDERPVLAIISEVQLSHDAGKRLSWPVYLTTLRARLDCDAMLLVVCPQQTVARWCAKPIALGHPGFTLTPIVLHPDRVPFVTDPDEAQRSPELAVLSALAYGGRPGGQKVLAAMVAGIDSLEQQRRAIYSDIVSHALPAAARSYLEALMGKSTSYEYQSDFVRGFIYQGRAEGETQAVLVFLEARGIEVPADVRSRILATTDIDDVTTLVRRAATVTSVAELFD